jgi:hypothetical protein
MNTVITIYVLPIVAVVLIVWLVLKSKEKVDLEVDVKNGKIKLKKK